MPRAGKDRQGGGPPGSSGERLCVVQREQEPWCPESEHLSCEITDYCGNRKGWPVGHFSPTSLLSHHRKKRVENLLRTPVPTGHLGLRTCTLKKLQELVFSLKKTFLKG